MDPEFILDKISSWLYEDTNDVSLRPTKPTLRPRVTPRVPTRPGTFRTSPKPPVAVPEAVLKRVQPPNAKIVPSLSKELKIRIDKSTGKPIIPEGWFNDRGKLKYSREELNKAVQNARNLYRAERRAARVAQKAQFKRMVASRKMSASYAAEVEILGKNFSFPNISRIASRGVVVIGVLSGLYSLLTGYGLESNDENIQIALDNGTTPLEGTQETPLISHALYKIQDLVPNLKTLYDNKQLSNPEKIKKLASAYRQLKNFTVANVNNKSDAQRLYAQASNLSSIVGEASEALDGLSTEIEDENTKEKIESLQDTLAAIIVTVNNAQEIV